MNRRAFVVGSIAFAAAGPSRAASRGIRALTGDSFFDGASEVRLAEVIAPDPLDSYGHKATLALNRLIATAPLSIEDVAPRDRWGRRIAKVTLGAGARTLQEAVVQTGNARVRPQRDDAVFIGRLLLFEDEARRAKRGLWAERQYRIFAAADAAPAVGAFNLVEGVVVGAVTRGGRAYLNFGEDYRTDFTATARSGAARRWAKEGLDLHALEGARVRVRGYVAWINGPSIELTHRQALEILEPASEIDRGTPSPEPSPN